MELRRRALRHVDQAEYEHFLKYGEQAYGLTPQEIKGYDHELGEERAFDSVEHSYPEDYYFDIVEADTIVGRVLLLKMGHYFQLDFMVFDPYTRKGIATKAVSEALASADVLTRHEVRARVLDQSPHAVYARRILETNGFSSTGNYFVKGRRRRFSLQRN
ncbi:GNAT family N-acetyltransferase [Exiguobacterium sp. TDN 0502]|uniref:GNAT family N-acetyltransferase n=1 Tax=Exiguobacterium sp. TDN 0502 TaxID=3420731 RepID=UPI003D779730